MRCVLCEEPIAVTDKLVSRLIAHRECLLRTAVGGIGHLENHEYWCLEVGDPDGGRSSHQSALECDDWVVKYGIAASIRLP